ncbi:MAG: ferredoxin [Acidobacteria bacterium CG_4_9_14_3_um_filter_49_7]|nr:MAG: ferredoxin [Acidobacteria bacterium CG_4_9_14_3_um_filter_49_7]
MAHEYLHNVVTLKLDQDKCIGCGRCVEVCPHRVFRLNDRKADIVQHQKCMECGACALNCPVEVISVRSGVGCAYAVLKGKSQGTGPDCGCCG